MVQLEVHLQAALPKLIGVYSPSMASGKTTVAEYLVNDHGYVRVPFAASLKKMVHALLVSAGIPPKGADHYVYGPMKETPIPELHGVTPRYLMQTLGTNWRDCVDVGLFSSIAIAKARTEMIKGGRVVIDDLRFPHEYHAIKQEGGKVWMVYRDGIEPTSPHPSEGLLNYHRFDYEIHNDGSLDDLRAEVAFLVS